MTKEHGNSDDPVLDEIKRLLKEERERAFTVEEWVAPEGIEVGTGGEGPVCRCMVCGSSWMVADGADPEKVRGYRGVNTPLNAPTSDELMRWSKSRRWWECPLGCNANPYRDL